MNPRFEPLAKAFDRAGFRGPELAEAIADQFEDHRNGHLVSNLMTFVRHNDQMLVLNFDLAYQLGGGATVTGTQATHYNGRLEDYLATTRDDRSRDWQSFEGLPTIGQVFTGVRQARGLHEAKIIALNPYPMNINKNNLENLQNEVDGLKFPPEFKQKMEENMAKGESFFQLKGQVPVEKGQMDFAMNFRKSSQSEYYYFNSYQLAYSDKAPKLPEGHQYLVISPNSGGPNLMRKFDSPVDAIIYFKEQKGNSELAIGKPKDLDLRLPVATMNDGKVDYVAKDYRQFYYTPAMTHTQYLDQGKGYNLNQAGNMLQGHAVYRDDLVNRKTGQQYAAWAQFQFNLEKDRYGNYQVKQMSDPAYGFDLQKELQGYKIKELDQPKKLEVLVEGLKDGFRMPVTAIKPDGTEMKLNVEAMPRYGNLNFYQENGKPEHREQFQKAIGQEQLKEQGKTRGKSKAEEQEMSI